MNNAPSPLSTPRPAGGGAPIGVIIPAVLVPVLLITTIIVCISWYRKKKNPPPKKERRGVKLGRNFSRYQNPAYQNRQGGTLSLVREGQTVDAVRGVENLAFENDHYEGPADTVGKDIDLEKGTDVISNRSVLDKDRKQGKKGENNNAYEDEVDIKTDNKNDQKKEKPKSLTIDRNFNDVSDEEQVKERGETNMKAKKLTLEIERKISDSDDEDEIRAESKKQESMQNKLVLDDDVSPKKLSDKTEEADLEKAVEDTSEVVLATEVSMDVNTTKITPVPHLESDTSIETPKRLVIEDAENMFEKVDPEKLKASKAKDTTEDKGKDKNPFEEEESQTNDVNAKDTKVDNKIGVKPDTEKEEINKLLLQEAENMFEKVDPEKLKASKAKDTTEDKGKDKNPFEEEESQTNNVNAKDTKVDNRIGVKPDSEKEERNKLLLDDAENMFEKVDINKIKVSKENSKEVDKNPFDEESFLDEMKEEVDKITKDIDNTSADVKVNIGTELELQNGNMIKIGESSLEKNVQDNSAKTHEIGSELNPFDMDDDSIEIDKTISEFTSSQNTKDTLLNKADEAKSSLNDSAKDKQFEELASQMALNESGNKETTSDEKKLSQDKSKKEVISMENSSSYNPFDEPTAEESAGQSETNSSPNNSVKNKAEEKKSEKKDSEKKSKKKDSEKKSEKKESEISDKAKSGPNTGQPSSSKNIQEGKEDSPVAYSMDDIDAILMDSYAIDESISKANEIKEDSKKSKKKSSKKRKSSVKGNK